MAENLMGKGENGGHQHFLLCLQDFVSPPLSERLCGKGLKYNVDQGSATRIFKFQLVSF